MLCTAKKLGLATTVALGVTATASGIAGASTPWSVVANLKEVAGLDSVASTMAKAMAQGESFVSLPSNLAFENPVVEYGMGSSSVESILSSGQFPAPASTMSVYGLGSATAANGTIWVVTVFSTGPISLSPDPRPTVPTTVPTTVPAPVPTTAPTTVPTHVVTHPQVTKPVNRTHAPSHMVTHTAPNSTPWELYAAYAGVAAYGLFLVAKRRKPKYTPKHAATRSSRARAGVTP
jgi:hypothetical protein